MAGAAVALASAKPLEFHRLLCHALLKMVRTKSLLWLFFGLMALAPVSTFAMQQTVLDFRGSVPGNWNVGGLEQPIQDPAGLLLEAKNTEGSFITNISFTQRVQTVSITMGSATNAEIAFLWHLRGTPENSFTPLPFTVEASASQQIDLNVEAFPQWNSGQVDRVGLAFPAGSQVLLQDIQFKGWNFFERMWEVMSSFWVFDTYLPNSINFVWGPIITFNPVGTDQLFSTMPPRGNSGMWIVYGACALAIFGCVAWSRKRGDSPWKKIALCLFVTWMVMDIRMGAELLNYAYTDMSSYSFKREPPRVFRSYYTLNDTIEDVRPDIAGTGKYVAIGPERTPFITLLRYYLYPDLPVNPDESAGVNTWFVYERPDVTITDDGRVAINGEPVSAPGTILRRMSEHSFLFRISL